MARQKKKRQRPYWVVPAEAWMEIHLSGEILSNTVFQEIVELMKENRESENPKAVRFVVSGSSMMMSVRYAFPSMFYESVVLESQTQAGGNEVLKNAAGM